MFLKTRMTFLMTRTRHMALNMHTSVVYQLRAPVGNDDQAPVSFSFVEFSRNFVLLSILILPTSAAAAHQLFTRRKVECDRAHRSVGDRVNRSLSIKPRCELKSVKSRSLVSSGRETTR